MFGRLDKERTRAYMIESHRSRKQADGSPYYRHSAKVAKLADGFATTYYRQKGNLIFPMDQVTIKDVWHAGMLHDAIDHGRAYDDILEATSLSVANIVSATSSDMRLPRPRRLLEYCNRLHLAEPPAQIIKLACLACNLQMAIELIQADEISKTTVALTFWPQELRDCVSAIDTLKDSRLVKEWTWCNETAELLDKVCKRWKRRHDILGELLDAFPKQKRHRL